MREPLSDDELDDLRERFVNGSGAYTDSALVGRLVNEIDRLRQPADPPATAPTACTHPEGRLSSTDDWIVCDCGARWLNHPPDRLVDAAREVVRFYGTDRTWSLIYRTLLGSRIDDLEHALAAHPTPAEEPPDYEQMRKDRGWPTPNHMRRTADALDSLTPARYGDVLRWFADLADAALDAAVPSPAAVASAPEETK